MRLLLQRVREASVRVNDQIISQINQGLLVFVGIEEADNEEDASWLAKKTISMRLFSDEKGLMNLSLEDVNGSLLVVSQFTLHALTKKGTDPHSSKPLHRKKPYHYTRNSWINWPPLSVRKRLKPVNSGLICRYHSSMMALSLFG